MTAGEDVRDLSLRTDDGVLLAGSHYPAAGRQFVAVAGATATPRRYYRHVAAWLQAHGVDVVLVDYRGIGGSREGSLRDLRDTRFADWCGRDLAAAVGWATRRGPTWLLGHSLGGHAIGQLPAPNELRGAYVVGTGTGWSGWMPRAEAVRVELLWRVLGPLTTSVLGYLPMRAFRMGEDIPLGVYRDWKRWCALPRYFFDDPEAADITAAFSEVHIPIAAVAATDDAWAPPASRDAFVAGYSAASLDLVDVSPAELGVPAVGHMGYFRPQVGEALWPRMLGWFRTHGLDVAGGQTTRGEAGSGRAGDTER